MILMVLMKMVYIKILVTDFDSYGIHQYVHDKYDSKGFNIKGEHKDTKTTCDPNGFDRYGIHQYTHDKYDGNGFDRYGKHKDTKAIFDTNGFNRDGINQYTNDKYDANGFDRYGNKKPSKIKTSKAKSFKDQKGKGHVNLTIALSKIYTNNSSKELINNIKQLINDLCNTKQITKQVHNNLIKAITYG